MHIPNSIDDLRQPLHNVITAPRLMTHVMKSHQAVVHSIYETADSSNRKKRRRTMLPEPAGERADVTALRLSMDNTRLKCWPLTIHAASFIRPPKHSDRNTLIHVKKSGMGPASSHQHEALIFITIYNKLSWNHRQLFRLSQHVLLASQTLDRLFAVIPCHWKELPQDIAGNSSTPIEYSAPSSNGSATREGTSGCVICIDGVLYGDGQNLDDYSSKLLQLYQASQNEQNGNTLRVGPTMPSTVLASLSFELHKPYWLLHAGNCEHFLVVDQIRMYHPDDPLPSAYPLTNHITPPLLDLCRACSKVPATFAVIGDVRLGESPFVICGPCWRWMGIPNGMGSEDVSVIPLPRHEHGWGGVI
ncbi:hypothetical protein WOLCODRAFT_26180 [Wolfiporia cocos MD-104 SS10]|uniref:snRNA-activating protein complex subunit 3 n=1 Tax=Wolfiporia cocos (strain MD-104) TaxID=742152 RepID=A0A2H3JUX2_WOLCO|nr:hypothetical protein WOLCODRAFT_26180 [Wolfiporia cocos MD-104 SS10]